MQGIKVSNEAKILIEQARARPPQDRIALAAKDLGGGDHDIGLGAEDVAKVAPSFTFTDRKGEITGVKYDRLNILLINAVKEQQKQIATLVTSNAALNARLRGVEKSLRKKAGSARRRR